jgi:hypothetical protein
LYEQVQIILIFLSRVEDNFFSRPAVAQGIEYFYDSEMGCGFESRQPDANKAALGVSRPSVVS